MFEQFDIKNGIINSLKAALKDDGFIVAVFDMLLGRERAAQEVEYALKRASQEQTLNEVVSVHRLYKQTVSEGVFNKDTDKKGLMRQLKEIRGKSNKFMRKVLIRTLKEKGMLGSFLYIIKALATPGYVLDDLLAAPQAIRFIVCLIKNAAELAGEDQEMRLAVNESVMIERMRRMLGHASRNRSLISEEEMTDKYGGRMPVNVYVGRFQPFHIGHLSNLEAAAERGLRTVICPVMAGKTAKSIAAHPFNGAIEDEMFNRLKAAYGDLIADIIPISRPSLDCWVDAIRSRGMEPITWTTGMDRKPAYEAMIQRYGADFGLVDNFEVIGLDKNVGAGGGSADDKENVEGRAVRECLMNSDKEGFMRQMPKCLWDMYDEMRQVLAGNAEPAQAAALAEDKAYDEYKKMVDEAIERLVKGNK